jgi:beta-lactam-binding protein with PASTA domain
VTIKQLITNRKFWINIGAFVISVLLVIILLSVFLRIYTHHGESLTVPDFKGRTIDEVQKICDDKMLRYEVKDSVFTSNQPKFTVVEQNPKPGEKVKEYRRIYLVINTGTAPKIQMPNLEYSPRRQAEKILESVGLKSGTNPEYTHNIALNAVIQTKYKGQIIMPGTMIEKGSTIDFVLGDGGKGGVLVPVPDLENKTLVEARFILTGDNLLLGKIDSTGVKKMNTAIIYKQSPLSGNSISQGDIVNVSLKDK